MPKILQCDRPGCEVQTKAVPSHQDHFPPESMVGWLALSIVTFQLQSDDEQEEESPAVFVPGLGHVFGGPKETPRTSVDRLFCSFDCGRKWMMEQAELETTMAVAAGMTQG